jgi:hypothetical protein
LFFGLDRCNNFLDLCFLHLRLFLDKATMRWNIFNIERVSYLETWLKLDCTSLAVDAELDLQLLRVHLQRFPRDSK